MNNKQRNTTYIYFILQQILTISITVNIALRFAGTSRINTIAASKAADGKTDYASDTWRLKRYIHCAEYKLKHQVGELGMTDMDQTSYKTIILCFPTSMFQLVA